MKLTSKLALLSVAVGLSAVPAAHADEAAPDVVTAPEETVIEEPTLDPTDEEKPVVDEQPTEDEVTPDDEVVVEDGGEVPIDWVKRGSDGEDPNVIFYNMAGGGDQPSGPATSPVAKDDAGKDEAATATEAKTVAPVAPIVREKKGPVALVKGARVFLRH